MTCPHCVEPILPEEPTRIIIHDGSPARFHVECVMRMVVGSAAHQLGDCSCTGGTREEPPGLTKRQCAILAYGTFKALSGEGVPLESIR